jgi:uncharacterized protein (TIGR03435 family)
MRCRSLALVAVLALTVDLAAQSSAPPPAPPARFEVASIKVNPLQSRGGPRRLSDFTLSVVRLHPGGRVESIGNSLQNLIAWAYQLNGAYQRVEGPEDMLLTEFDIAAKAEAATVTGPEVRAMMRTLLEERLQLRWHWQPREIDSYLLVPARNDGRQGPALEPFTDDCAARASGPSVPFTSPEWMQKARCGWTGYNGEQRGVGVSMATIAERLTIEMMAPVADRTGWPGLFSFNVIADTSGMPFQERARASSTLGARLATDQPPLLDVFRSDLGLKLTKERRTVTDFVVDSAGPLIEN